MMASVNLYFYVEDLALTVQQRNTIVTNLKAWGDRNADGNPKERNHWRIRPNGKAAIFEMWVDDGDLTVLFFRQALATIFGVALATITGSAATNAYGSLATFTYASVARFRMGVFGGVSATYAQSQAAVTAFLAANAAEWGEG
jgi:hypothetical protein